MTDKSILDFYKVKMKPAKTILDSMLGSKLLGAVPGVYYNKNTGHCLGDDKCTYCGNGKIQTVEHFLFTCSGCEDSKEMLEVKAVEKNVEFEDNPGMLNLSARTVLER